MVASLDGAATVRGRTGGLSGGADRQVFALLRALADVIVVGAGTARTEGYGPVPPGKGGGRRARARAGPAPPAVARDTPRVGPAPAGPPPRPAPRLARPLDLAHVLADDGHLICRYVRPADG